MDDLLLLRDVPPAFISEVSQALAQFTIGFLQVPTEGSELAAELLGSGVLITVGTKSAILTAHHVAEKLPSSGQMGLFLGRTSQVHAIDAAGKSIIKIGRGSREIEGPDLAAVVLAPHIASGIAAKKSFFALDPRRDKMLADFDLRGGFWFAQGFVHERTVVRPDSDAEGFTKYFFNFTAVGGPDQIEAAGKFDYFNFPIDEAARGDDVPKKWGGMSGCGVWLVPVKRTDEGLSHLPPTLAGIVFFQHGTAKAELGVRSHGPRSIYDVAYRAIAGNT